jgi:hypothetical protein
VAGGGEGAEEGRGGEEEEDYTMNTESSFFLMKTSARVVQGL